MLNRIKSQSVTGLHCKYTDVTSTLSSSPTTKRLPTMKDKNINLKNQLNNHHFNGLKSDTYESVCPPDDIVERTKQSHKNSVIRNHFDQNNGSHNSKCNASCKNLHNCSNSSSTVAEGASQSNSNNSSNNHNNNCSNLNRNLKRVSSAPPPPIAVQQTNNETGKEKRRIRINVFQQRIEYRTLQNFSSFILFSLELFS